MSSGSGARLPTAVAEAGPGPLPAAGDAPHLGVGAPHAERHAAPPALAVVPDGQQRALGRVCSWRAQVTKSARASPSPMLTAPRSASALASVGFIPFVTRKRRVFDQAP